MVRLSYFAYLALAAQGLHAAPSVSRDQGSLQTRHIRASKQVPHILPRQERKRDDDMSCPTKRPGGKTAAEDEAQRIAKGGDNGGFPSPQEEGRTQLTNSQRNGFRGGTKFQDTPGGKAAAGHEVGDIRRV